LVHNCEKLLQRGHAWRGVRCGKNGFCLRKQSRIAARRRQKRNRDGIDCFPVFAGSEKANRSNGVNDLPVIGIASFALKAPQEGSNRCSRVLA
jgi:hypothetical protein